MVRVRKLVAQQLEDRLALAVDFVRHEIVPSTEHDTNDVFVVKVGDLNGDDLVDIVKGHRNGVSWHANLKGKTTFGSEKQIIDERSAGEMELQDIDLDGDLDLIAIFRESKLGWLENLDGKGAFGDIQWIDNISGSHSVQLFSALAVSDVDMDGDIDVIVGSNTLLFDREAPTQTGTIIWYENLDGRGAFSKANEIGTLALVVGRQMVVLDVDKDGDHDIGVSASDWFGRDISSFQWYENLDGAANDWSAHLVISGGGPQAYAFGDIDSDGDPDLVALHGRLADFNGSYRLLSWYENTGLGDFKTASRLNTRITEPDSVKLTLLDFDSDGSMDLMFKSLDSWSFAERRSNGAFEITERVNHLYNWHVADVGDIDEDGDMDFIGFFTCCGGNRGGQWFESVLSAKNDEFQTMLNNPISVSAPGILANDSHLAVSAELLAGPSFGNVEIDKRGGFVYTPSPGFIGTDTFTYHAVDARGHKHANATIVQIEVLSPPGDANMDGQVTFADFFILSSNFGATGVSRTEGDFDGDGKVGFSDFLILSANY